jgi:biopolymer transport protein ExbD
MALRKKKKHGAEVNMSSMTDIIFMLLIFFMLTSTLIKYLPFKLPESSQRTNAKIKTTVGIEKSGRLTVNDQIVKAAQLESLLKASLAISPDKLNPTITIAAEEGVPFGEITKVMAVANRLKARTILATAPIE